MYDSRRILFRDPGNITKKKSSLIKDDTLIKIFGIATVLLIISFVVGIFKCINIFNIYPEEINEVIENGELKEGKYVRVGVYATYDYYADLVEYMEDYENSDYVVEKYYPIILDDGSIISLSVRGNENMGKMSEIYAATLEYMYDETGTKLLHTPVVIEGKLEKIKKGTKQREYYDDFVEALLKTYDAWEPHPNIYYYNIKSNMYSSMEKWIAVIVVAGLGVALIIAVSLLLKTIKHKKTVKQNEINNKNKIERLKKNNYLMQRDSLYKDDADDDDETDESEELSGEPEETPEETQENEMEDDLKDEFSYARFKYTEKYNNNSRDDMFF